MGRWLHALAVCGLGLLSTPTHAVAYGCAPGRFERKGLLPICSGVCRPGSYGADCTGTCSPGQYSGHGYPICLPCPAGKYQTSPGSASCPACAIGQYTNAGESPFCNICDMGQINLVAGSTDCKLLTHHATGPPTPPPTPTPPTPHPTIYRKFCDRIQVTAPGHHGKWLGTYSLVRTTSDNIPIYQRTGATLPYHWMKYSNKNTTWYISASNSEPKLPLIFNNYVWSIKSYAADPRKIDENRPWSGPVVSHGVPTKTLTNLKMSCLPPTMAPTQAPTREPTRHPTASTTKPPTPSPTPQVIEIVVFATLSLKVNGDPTLGKQLTKNFCDGVASAVGVPLGDVFVNGTTRYMEDQFITFGIDISRSFCYTRGEDLCSGKFKSYLKTRTFLKWIAAKLLKHGFPIVGSIKIFDVKIRKFVPVHHASLKLQKQKEAKKALALSMRAKALEASLTAANATASAISAEPPKLVWYKSTLGEAGCFAAACSVLACLTLKMRTKQNAYTTIDMQETPKEEDRSETYVRDMENSQVALDAVQTDSYGSARQTAFRDAMI